MVNDSLHWERRVRRVRRVRLVRCLAGVRT
jgi:hypothetical protein